MLLLSNKLFFFFTFTSFLSLQVYSERSADSGHAIDSKVARTWLK